MKIIKFLQHDNLDYIFRLVDPTGLPLSFEGETLYFQIERDLNVWAISTMEMLAPGVWSMNLTGEQTSEILGLYNYRIIAVDDTTEAQRVVDRGEVFSYYAPPFNQVVKTGELSADTNTFNTDNDLYTDGSQG